MSSNINDIIHGKFGGTADPADGTWHVKFINESQFIRLTIRDLAGNTSVAVMKPEELQSLLIGLTSTLNKSQIKPSPKQACSCKACYVCWEFGKAYYDEYQEVKSI